MLETRLKNLASTTPKSLKDPRAYVAQAMRSLRVHLVRVRRLAADDEARLTAAAAEHAAIAEAIAAEAATTVHLHRSLSHIKATHTPK